MSSSTSSATSSTTIASVPPRSGSPGAAQSLSAPVTTSVSTSLTQHLPGPVAKSDTAAASPQQCADVSLFDAGSQPQAPASSPFTLKPATMAQHLHDHKLALQQARAKRRTTGSSIPAPVVPPVPTSSSAQAAGSHASAFERAAVPSSDPALRKELQQQMAQRRPIVDAAIADAAADKAQSAQSQATAPANSDSLLPPSPQANPAAAPSVTVDSDAADDIIPPSNATLTAFCPSARRCCFCAS